MLWVVTKKLLIVSHGQATVENLKENLVVLQQVVYNSIAGAKGLCAIPITNSHREHGSTT